MACVSIGIRVVYSVLFYMNFKSSLSHKSSKKYGIDISLSKMKSNTTITFLNSFESEIQRRLVTEQIRHCPHTKMCKFEFEKFHDHGADDLCCKSCACDNSSSWYNLCPDLIPTMYLSLEYLVPETEKYTCVSTSFALHVAQGARGVSICPLGSDKHTSMKCMENPVWKGFSTNFTDITPVTSIQSGVTYQNRHCAACNGEAGNNLVEWINEYHCKNFDTFLEVSSTSNFSSTCNIFYKPEVSVEKNVTHCFISEPRCNVTGRWKVYDPFIENACGKYIAEVVTEDMLVYRNIFCALCNGYEGVKTICELYANLPIGRQDSILLLLDTRKTIEKDNTQCSYGYIFNKHKDECIKAFCSPLRSLVGNECIPVVHEANLFKYIINLRIIPVKPTNYSFVIANIADVTNWIVQNITFERYRRYTIQAKERIVVVDIKDSFLFNDTKILYSEISIAIELLETHQPSKIVETLFHWFHGVYKIPLSEYSEEELEVYIQTVDYNNTVGTRIDSIVQAARGETGQCTTPYDEGGLTYQRERLQEFAWMDERSQNKLVIPIIHQACVQNKTKEKPGLSVVKLYTCLMVEISKDTYVWEEDVYGIHFPDISHSLSTADYMYRDKTKDSVFVCMEALQTLQEKSASSGKNVSHNAVLLFLITQLIIAIN